MRPSVINPNVISMQLNMDSKKPCGKPDYFKLGILFGEDLHVSTDYGEKDDAYEIYVMQALKLLSDKSKFEILSYTVSQVRSDYGAVQNRLEHTISNLNNIIENTTAAESLIRDTDIAKEMVAFSNNRILLQAGTRPPMEVNLQGICI